MTVEAQQEIDVRERVAQRIRRLRADDDQFRGATPDAAARAAARQPDLRLPQVLETLVAAYADRPALGWRARTLTTDPSTGRTSAQLLPRFDTISYGELWANVGAIAAAWRRDAVDPVSPGDFVATLGFASPEYLTVDLVCAYLGLVAVPLQHNASGSRLRPIIAETEPRVLAVGAGYLDLAVEAALGSASIRRLVVFDYRAEVDDHREALQRARDGLASAGMAVTIEALDDVLQRGRSLPAEPMFTGADAQRLALIMYTSGSTGLPKGAMWSEQMVTKLWTNDFMPDYADVPVLNVNFMPMNHVGGRIPLSTAFQAGGTSYFVPESDLSTLFDDWSLVRPTEMGLVPRVAEMLYQRYQSAVDRLSAPDGTTLAAEAQARAELCEQVLGGRVVTSFSSTAPLAAEMKSFIETCLDVHVMDGYGLTEVGMVTKDGWITRPPVTDYKLVDVPELGYFRTDKPYPRGELLVKSQTATAGYFKRPDVTANAFDAEGYYRTGDVMAELEPDRLSYVDRRNNVLKLAQGEFVAVARLEADFASAAWVRQIFVYGNSERPYLLAVVVPTGDALAAFAGDDAALKTAISESLRQTAKLAELQSYEVPADFIVESIPFSEDNGLLSGVGKLLRPKLKEHYGERLEALYTELADTRTAELRALRDGAADRPVIETLTKAAEALLGLVGAPEPDAHFMDLGGDSLSALTFSNLLQDLFDVEVPVGLIIGPTTDLALLARHITTARESGSKRPTFTSVHGHGATEVRAADLKLDKFIDAKTLAAAASLPRPTGTPHTVLLTGGNGYLGRFLTLEWLQRVSGVGGRLIAIVRGSDAAAAYQRLEAVYHSDPELLQRFRDLAAEHLEVVPGDIGEPDLGVDAATWSRLARSVDLIVHPAALVNHVLPYDQLFGPNVVGTAELIRLAITDRIKPITYLSTVAVASPVDPAEFEEDGDIRVTSPTRAVDDSYANGYGNSKWGGEVLLREAHDLCGLPVAVFRSDMILAHSRYAGQLNVPDMFTRLLFSLLVTGVAPRSFYRLDAGGDRPRAHYAGLPADFVAEAVATLGAEIAVGAAGPVTYRSFDVMNPHDDGVSLDVFVDWLIDAGHDIRRIDDHDEWLARFETAMRALPDTRRQHSVLPLLDAYRAPERPLRGASAPTDVFRAAVQDAKVGVDQDIPHLTPALIDKYVADLRSLGLI